MQSEDGRQRVIVEGVTPTVDNGRFPAKRVAGDRVRAEADIFADGHDVISAALLYRPPGATQWIEVPMAALVNDRWRAEFVVEKLGFYLFTVEGWIDHFLTWHRDLGKRLTAGASELEVQLQIGVEMIEAAAERAKGRDRTKLQRYAADAAAEGSPLERADVILSGDIETLMQRNAERRFVQRAEIEYMIEVDRPRAAFSTWYEMFPRSTAAEPGQHGTFETAASRLPAIARMGFDVVYLPPIHPIGTSHRKGPNNREAAAAGDPGSPWAIGSAEGGHRAVHRQLGTLDGFRKFLRRAEAAGLEIALDMAFQASPDHPAVREHPEWFQRRPDGTIQYAENPPKKYQDIYPFYFESEGWKALWEELRDIFLFWIDEGVKIFRVDNPHTKPLPFWQWIVAEVKRRHPDVIFLAEAFTRPKIMYYLAKAGFSQSYTYFAWRNSKSELTDYFSEITRPPVSDFFRPNVWPNTPDILTEYLQSGGRPAFLIRLILAATLSSSYGIYGPVFERFIGEARDAGGEEYLHSEKYEIRHWAETDDDAAEMIALINRIRRENAALQENTSLVFHETSNDQVICYSKSEGANALLVAVNLDPYNPQSAWLDLSLGDLQIDQEKTFQVHDLLSGARFSWHGPRNFVQLNPKVVPAHIFRLRRKIRSERDFEYYL